MKLVAPVRAIVFMTRSFEKPIKSIGTRCMSFETPAMATASKVEIATFLNAPRQLKVYLRAQMTEKTHREK